MKEYRYDITICTDNSAAEFRKACRQIEKAYPMVQKEKLLIDVDGSTMQVYYLGGQKIVVYDDYDIGAVFALSDVDIQDALGAISD